MAQTAVADSRPKIEPKAPMPTVKGKDLEATIGELERLMLEAAKDLEFEKAAHLRDEIASLKKQASEGK
jgi:excinuclease ABC subunit B